MSELEKILNITQDKLKSVYLIYGEEKYLLNEFKTRFINKFISEENRDFNLTILENNDDFAANLKKLVNTVPILTGKRFIIIRTKEYFTQKTKEDELLTRLFKNFPRTTVLLIMVDGKVNKKLKVVNEIKKIGEIIATNPPKFKQLDNWIKNEFKKRGKMIDQSSVKLLGQMFNNELQRLEGEIEKITIYKYKEDRINFEDVKAVISKERLLEDNTIFAFTNALIAKKKGEALILLNEMIQDGEIPLKILGTIIWQLRLLLSVKVLKKKGKNPAEITKILNQHPYPIKICYRQSTNFTEEELELMMERFLQVNLDMVTGRYKDNKMALEMALLE